MYSTEKPAYKSMFSSFPFLSLSAHENVKIREKILLRSCCFVSDWEFSFVRHVLAVVRLCSYRIHSLVLIYAIRLHAFIL